MKSPPEIDETALERAGGSDVGARLDVGELERQQLRRRDFGLSFDWRAHDTGREERPRLTKAERAELDARFAAEHRAAIDEDLEEIFGPPSSSGDDDREELDHG